MQHYKTGLVIGRFQPFHNGHKYVLEQALKLCDHIIIVIGSSNKTDSNNPFSYILRKKMIETFLQKEGYAKKILLILPSPDISDDDAWRDAILEKTGLIDVVIGNNQQGSNIFFEKVGYPVIQLPFYKRAKYEGTKIRKLMSEKQSWEDRVPEEVVRILKQ